MIKLNVDFSKEIRPIGKLNGVNNGPLLTCMDASKEFKWMGVDFVRLHETHSPNTKCVEIPFIFRDYNADENDPDNYYFGETDVVIKGAVDNGIEIMYRLGMGTERPGPRIFMYVPDDFNKWARICRNIVAHYNEGWANGFHYGIKYWEIGNEADLYEYWPGTRDQYTDMYCTVAKTLKDYDPSLKIGPCGFSAMYGPEKPDPIPLPEDDEDIKRGLLTAADDWDDRVRFYNSFLATVREKEIPMDFFAWHYYVTESFSAEERMVIIDDLLKKHGFYGKVEVINTEWNNIHLSGDGHGHWDVSQFVTMRSATSCVASMITMQKYGITKAAYYDAESRSEFDGLYTNQHTYLKQAYSLKAIDMLRQGVTEVYTDVGTPTLRICASFNGKKGYIVLTNEGQTEEVNLLLKDLPSSFYTQYLFDETHCLTPVKKGSYTGRRLSVLLGAHSVIVFEFTVEEG